MWSNSKNSKILASVAAMVAAGTAVVGAVQHSLPLLATAAGMVVVATTLKLMDDYYSKMRDQSRATTTLKRASSH
jgi:hypothetical protein